MLIDEIYALDEIHVKEMAKESIEIKGHTVYFVDLGGYFGYSALVFAEGRHIYHANDYALHHSTMNGNEDLLREWYVSTMKNKLFTEDELRTSSDDYSVRTAKEQYLRNYYPMRREYQSVFGGEDKARDWYQKDKTSAVFSKLAFAYFKKEDRPFVNHMDELYKAFTECNNPLRDYDHAKQAFKAEMFDHEYSINSQGDWDVINCFCPVGYKGDGTELEQTGWSEEIKKAYRDAAKEVLAKQENL